MRRLIPLPLLLFTLAALALPPAEAVPESTKTGKGGSIQGLTVEEIGRGLQSAAKNIGNEIPKIGPAIGETFKKAMGSDKTKTQAKESPQHSTKNKKSCNGGG